MCGIAGFLHFENIHHANPQTLKAMTDSIAHRGPDGEGFYINNQVALGHRRLSIIDLNTGDQPMYNENKIVVLVFNGEIYNYIELRNELKSYGFKFSTESDTEVIIKAYEKWGVNCLSKLNGCWAFALWDDRKKQLFLSRDRLGEKPLYYSTYNNTFVFGSEIKSIIKYGIPKNPNWEMLELYLILTYIPDPYTFYTDIYSLEPGHFLIYKDGRISKHKYWELPEIDEKNMLKNKKYIYNHFNDLLHDSVKIRMRSDVPYGAFLSGGLDSSSIVSIMAQLSSHPVETFTMGFNYKAFDESQLAQMVAEEFNTLHHKYTVEPESFDSLLQKVAHHYDEPFGDSSAIPTGIISKFARKKVKMVLTGDGGDEVLSGYRSYTGVKLTSLYNNIPNWARKKIPCVLHILGNRLRGNFRYKMNSYVNFTQTAALDFNKRMVEKLCYTSLSSIKNLIPKNRACISIEDYMHDFMLRCPYKDDFYKLMYLNFKLSLPNDYLVKVDRMSMAHSLEARIPFIDHRLVEFMIKVDKNIKMDGLKRKSVLRETVGKNLPKPQLKASKKGFGVPLREWFKQEQFDKDLLKLYQTNWDLNNEAIESIIQENRAGQRDNGNFLWLLFVLKKWIEN